MKTYGKEPESLESITRIFKQDLIDYPSDKIMKAISTHAQRSGEFPTVSDIIGLIKRNGKPPMKESDIITIRKKDGADRTHAEWQMLKEWDNEQREGWRDEPDPIKDAATLAENIRLRKENKELKDEAKRAWDIVRKQNSLLANPIPSPEAIPDELIARTIVNMKANGASDDDIGEFLQSLES